VADVTLQPSEVALFVQATLRPRGRGYLMASVLPFVLGNARNVSLETRDVLIRRAN